MQRVFVGNNRLDCAASHDRKPTDFGQCGRLSGLNKLGRGQRKLGRVANLARSVPPPEIPLLILVSLIATQRGHARDHICEASNPFQPVGFQHGKRQSRKLRNQALWYIVVRLQTLFGLLLSPMFAFSKSHLRPIVLWTACVLLIFFCLIRFENVNAQLSAPVLISREDSTRAIAYESVTHQREPFTATAPIKFGSDPATRIMVFAMNLTLQPNEAITAVTADAEDANHNVHSLTVEHVGTVPDQPWATSIVLRLDEQLSDVGDVLVRIKYQGVISNRVRVGIGHVGGGLADDEGAVPTPGREISIAPPPPKTTNLTATDVQTLIAQAASAATSLGHPVTIIITDREANVLGFFPMSGSPATTTVRSVGTLGRGLEGASVMASQAATAKAATAAFFSTHGNAFSTRTAGFILQEHFPPGISFRPAGPLYGVQFSSLPCGDINRLSARLGLSGDPGGLPIYKNGEPAGGIGIEGDGLYTVDRDPTDNDQPFEELIAASALRGFEAPTQIRGDNILVDGIRLPYSNVVNPPAPPTIPFGSLVGAFVIFPPAGAPDSQFTPAMVGGISGEVSTRFFPFVPGTAPAGNALTAAEVNTIISHAAQQANITRAAIRQPLGSNARVTMAVVDTEGVVLGVFRQQDAPIFGYDVAVAESSHCSVLFQRDRRLKVACCRFWLLC